MEINNEGNDRGTSGGSYQDNPGYGMGEMVAEARGKYLVYRASTIYKPRTVSALVERSQVWGYSAAGRREKLKFSA